MISLCMIARDEERCLERCLSSVLEIVDEIIIVDTGSADRTKDIAVSFGARVYDIKWRDDFASARNYAISKATGSWLLSVDADEAIAECDGRIIRDLTVSAYSAAVAYSFVTRNYTRDANLVGWVSNNGEYPSKEAGTGWVPTEKIRLFPNQPEIRYEYPVHEMVEPTIRRSGIKIKKCDVPIHHYGSLENNHPKKMQFYYRLGRIKASGLNNSAVALYELAVQAGILGKMEEAIDLWEAFIDLRPNVPEAYVHLGTAYFQCGQYPAASRAAAKALNLSPGMREAQYNYCLAEYILGNITKAKAGLEKLTQAFPDFLPACLLLAAVDICAGNQARGLNEINRLKQSSLGNDLAATIRDLANRLKGENQTDRAVMLSRLI